MFIWSWPFGHPASLNFAATLSLSLCDSACCLTLVLLSKSPIFAPFLCKGGQTVQLIVEKQTGRDQSFWPGFLTGFFLALFLDPPLRPSHQCAENAGWGILEIPLRSAVRVVELLDFQNGCSYGQMVEMGSDCDLHCFDCSNSCHGCNGIWYSGCWMQLWRRLGLAGADHTMPTSKWFLDSASIFLHPPWTRLLCQLLACLSVSLGYYPVWSLHRVVWLDTFHLNMDIWASWQGPWASRERRVIPHHIGSNHS